MWVPDRHRVKEFPLDNPVGRIAGIGDRRSELFSNSFCYFSVAGEGFEKRISS